MKDVMSREVLHRTSLELIRSVIPAQKGIRLVGVTLSNFAARQDRLPAEASLGLESAAAAY